MMLESRCIHIDVNLHGMPVPERHGEFIDLSSMVDIEIKKGDIALIPLGISMKIPDGFYAEVFPRSSTYIRHGILMANSIGIIENDYCGDDDIWQFPAYAIRDTMIHKGDRIAQFRLMKQMPDIHFNPVESLGNQNRGGFGSTGK